MAGRGKRQDDARLFDASGVPLLRIAAGELAWLLGRGYSREAALKLVGDRHALLARQREALSRAVCTPEQAKARAAKRQASVAGQPVWIDGFNVLISIEAALAGGVLVRGLDGAVRDMASVHGSYRRVDQTHAALAELLNTLSAAGPSEVRWYFDRPVSNSGRAAQWVRELDAAGQGPWAVWEAECVDNPDRTLIEGGACVASSDAWVLDSAAHSFDLVGATLDRLATSHTLSLVDLRSGEAP